VTARPAVILSIAYLRTIRYAVTHRIISPQQAKRLISRFR